MRVHEAWSRRSVVGGLAALAAGSPASAAAPARLPMRLQAGKLFTPASINGAAVDALLDPGSKWTSIDAGLAAAVGVRSERRFVGELIQGRIEGGWAKGAAIRLGEAGFTPGRMVVVDYGPLSRQLGRPVQLVLGRDFFERFVWDLDFERGTLVLSPRDGYLAPADARRVDLQASRGRMTMPVTIENEPPLWAAVDLGNDLPLILSPGPRSKRLLQGKPVSTALIGGAGSGVVAQIATAARVGLAGVTLAQVPFEVAPRSIGFEANLGLPVLRRFRLSLDFGGRRMWLAPGLALATPFEKDRTGLNGFIDGGTLRILHVARGGPAERAGFKAGDAVVAIDGEAVVTANANLADAPPGRTLDFALSDGTHRRLTLADYY
jgi:hypothetical protein